jgi:hypothetical protein
MDTLFPELENGVSFGFFILSILSQISHFDILRRSLRLPLMYHRGSALHTYLTFWCVSRLLRTGLL